MKNNNDEIECLVDDNGNKFWYKNGKLHRDNGPAIESYDGTKYWWLNGLRHREDGPASEYINGDKFWYRNGLRHRLDGPAIETEGDKYWYKNGTKKWYINGENYTEQEFNKYKLNELNEDLSLNLIKRDNKTKLKI